MEPKIERDSFRRAIGDSIGACTEGSNVAIIVVKVRNLHKVNARLGYDKTDEIFRNAFQALTGSVRKVSMVTRFSSSSFGIIVSDLKRPQLIGVGLENVLRQVSGPFTLGDEKINLGVNAGASLYPSDGDSADLLLLRAEAALRSCGKQLGIYRLFHDLPRGQLEQWQVESDLKAAVDARQLSLNYQPQVRLGDGSTSGFESLLRWNHPDFGPISPERFIPLAEAGGMMDEITEWVLQSALRETVGTLDNSKDISISVNVSPTTLFDPGFPFVIESTLSLWGAMYQHLTVEITESVLMENFDSTLEVLVKLRNKGARISIDDFGTGYSSLAYFKKLPVDELKIDRAFIHNMINCRDDFKLVELMIQLAHIFDITVVAEGIEDKETMDALRDLGCDIGQGYYISEPMDGFALESWLDRNPARDLANQAITLSK